MSASASPVSLPDRPWRFLLLTVACALAAAALTGWALRAHPGFALVGQPGQHDQRGASAAACLDCHVPFVGTPASRCLSPGCHGNLATGTPPRTGPAMPVRFHVALRDEACGRCHEEHRTTRPRVFDHRLIPSEKRSACRRCHYGEGQKSHARNDAVSCGSCHGWTTWGGAYMDHRRVQKEACELCHAGPKTDRHQAVAGTCDACHQTSDWTPRATDQDTAK